MALAPSEWAARHSSIVQTLDNDSVKAALVDFWSSKLPRDHDWITSSLGKRLDIAQIVAWSCQDLPPDRDPNTLRAAAQPTVQTLVSSSLQVRDFKSVKILQKSAGSLVEVVKCRLDGQIYVLKSLVKGFARRNAAIQTPNNEAKLLQRQQLVATTQSSPLLTPQLLAAFQTQNSVHLLMEFVPSGDFSELLMAASSCGADYPGRASTGLLTEDWIFRYSVDMVQAISWVHSQGFVHRDIKPGNFLLDNTGHLKLCDFSSAAPFSEYHLSTPSQPDTLLSSRKVWNFYCSQPTGTCDYLSPEVLEAEEMRVLQRQQRYLSMSCDDILGSHFVLNEAAPDPSANDAAIPGPYGPELDWWSFGIMLYEMRFGILPFFADKMEQTYEYIKNHQQTLKLDPAVQCSVNLTLLIQQLLTTATQRLGRTSSQEVKDHPFYSAHHVDWSQQWPVQPPFLPKSNVPASSTSSPAQPMSNQAAYGSGNGDYSLSVISSVPSFSALYTGNPDDFPLFEDSREFDMAAAQPAAQDHLFQEASQFPEAQVNESPSASLLPRSTSEPAVGLQTSSLTPLRSREHSLVSSPAGARNAARWSDCDASFVGFSYLPSADAFGIPFAAVEATAVESKTGELSTAPSFADLAFESPSAWPTSTPAASTPFTRNGASSHSYPTPPSFAPSPAAAESVTKPVTVAPNAIGRIGAHLHHQTFVTPARKPSYMAMHDRFKQGQEQEAAIPEHSTAHYTPAVPQSPYPFPVASVARAARMTEGKKSALKRPHLERAHSATPAGGGSVGSDSRQSGGSNAIREISEREAWDEMMAAVQKSVRKKQKDVGFTPLSSVQKPMRILRSSTDPNLSAPVSEASFRGPETSSEHPSDNASLQVMAATSTTIPDVPSTLASTQPAQVLRSKPSRTVLVAPRPVVMLPTTESPYDSGSEGSMPGSPNHLFVPSHHALDIDMYDSDDSIDLAQGHRRGLNHKKSARQLLIRAQERGTPTKPKRTQSPSLTDAFGAPSPASSGTGAKWQGVRTRSSSPMLMNDNNSVHSLLSSRDTSYDKTSRNAFSHVRTRVLSSSEANGENQSPNTSTEVLSGSLGKTSVTFAPMSYGSVLGALAPLRDANGRTLSATDPSSGLPAHSRDGMPRNKALRRKDSGEMLSQYRKGMGRATSMMSLSAQAKADAAATSTFTNSATASGLISGRGSIGGGAAGPAPVSISPPADDDFILGNVENRIRAGTSGAISSSHRALRRFSSALPGKDRNKTESDRPSSQDGGGGRSIKGFGRFKSRMTTSSTLSEDPSEASTSDHQPRNAITHTKLYPQQQQQQPPLQTQQLQQTVAQDAAAPVKSTVEAVEIAQKPRLQISKSQYRLRDTFPRSFGLGGVRNASPPVPMADISLMTGLNQRNTVLQGSLFGLEQRLAKLKARLED